ncbi:MAG: NADH:ubiquinone reductase (Na(+)-transporting) subunit F [Bacteroidetes bacterium]|nr:NADH:ubiquinone reductase (Na(+)-transporting) subunit F [Bacteroidota bacterium]
MDILVYSFFAFLIVILLLTSLLLYAKAKLVPSGQVNIFVNGDTENPLTASPGSTLLTTLSEKSVFLPSACGGGGTCALCKCQVIEGGGEVLPTELNYLTKKQADDNWRLACQVKVREDMEIKVPEEIFGIKKWECEVISNHNVATFIKEFIVKLPEGETLDFESGGYIQIDVPEGVYNFDDMDIEDEYKEDWDKFKLWDLKTTVDEEIFRAYSMANHPAEGNQILLNIRIASPPWDRSKNGWMDVEPGLCSSYTFTRKPGDKVMISGPFGEFFIKPTEKEMVYIGGGAGMAPLRSHIYHLFHTLKTDRKVTFFYGGRSLRELFYTDNFRDIEKEFPNFKYHVGLSEPLPDDNWEGATGFIHEVALEEYLKDHPEPEEIEYYLCGPPQMLDAIFDMLDNLGVPEENIAYDEF